MATVIIGNVNCLNEHKLDVVAGEFGYKGMVRVVDECTRSIRRIANCTQDHRDFQSMIGLYAMSGFTVTVNYDD